MRRLRLVLLLPMLAVWARGGEVPRDDEPPRPVHREETHRVVEAIVRLQSTNRDDRLRALETIQRFPDRAIPFLIKAARQEDRMFRARVANALGLVGKGDRDALFAITTLLKDPDAFVRREALAALLKAGDPSHVAEVEPLLDDPVEAVRADAVQGMAALAPKEADPRMRKLLEHKDPRVRRTALAVLLARKADGLDERLATLLKDPDGGMRGDAAEALVARATTKERKDAAAEALMGLLDDKAPFVVATAIDGLEALGAKKAVPKLVGLLDGQPVSVRAEAISALGVLGGQTVVRALAAQLAVSSSILRQRAAMALGLMGQDARSAVPALIQLLADKDERVRQKADLALRLILRTRVGYRAGASEQERLEGMRKWQEAWQKAKK